MKRVNETANRNAESRADAYRVRAANAEEVGKLAQIEAEASERFRESSHPEIADAQVHDADEFSQAARAGGAC